MDQKWAQEKPAGAADITGTLSTDVIMFTATTASKVNALPQGWAGEYAWLQPIGTDIYFFFVVTPTVAAPANTIALPPAATDGGAQAATQGELVTSGTKVKRLIPNCPIGGAVWFCRWGVTAAQSVQLTKASGRPGFNTVL